MPGLCIRPMLQIDIQQNRHRENGSIAPQFSVFPQSVYPGRSNVNFVQCTVIILDVIRFGPTVVKSYIFGIDSFDCLREIPGNVYERLV